VQTQLRVPRDGLPEGIHHVLTATHDGLPEELGVVLVKRSEK
jgi:hypothetical protein